MWCDVLWVTKYAFHSCEHHGWVTDTYLFIFKKKPICFLTVISKCFKLHWSSPIFSENSKDWWNQFIWQPGTREHNNLILFCRTFNSKWKAKIFILSKNEKKHFFHTLKFSWACSATHRLISLLPDLLHALAREGSEEKHPETAGQDCCWACG